MKQAGSTMFGNLPQIGLRSTNTTAGLPWTTDFTLRLHARASVELFQVDSVSGARAAGPRCTWCGDHRGHLRGGLLQFRLGVERGLGNDSAVVAQSVFPPQPV